MLELKSLFGRTDAVGTMYIKTPLGTDARPLPIRSVLNSLTFEGGEIRWRIELDWLLMSLYNEIFVVEI